MSPTKDDYTDRTTSTKEYEIRTNFVSTVIILKERCRAVDGINAVLFLNVGELILFMHSI